MQDKRAQKAAAKQERLLQQQAKKNQKALQQVQKTQHLVADRQQNGL